MEIAFQFHNVSRGCEFYVIWCECHSILWVWLPQPQLRCQVVVGRGQTWSLPMYLDKVGLQTSLSHSLKIYIRMAIP